MRKRYNQAPLPFVGQKCMFATQFIKIQPQFEDKTIFVDLFGGSGFLFHIAKRERPDATVVYKYIYKNTTSREILNLRQDVIKVKT